jgi:hypothetical protein
MPVILNRVEKDHDGIVTKFSFDFRGKTYTVEPKNKEGADRLDEYLKYVAGVCNNGNLNPFMYKYKGKSPKDLFSIVPSNAKKEEYDLSSAKKVVEETLSKVKTDSSKKINEDRLKKLKKIVPPEGEQMSLFASDGGRVSRVLLRYANWSDNDATLFWDEIANQEIPLESTKMILGAFKKGADTEFSVSKVTGVDSYTCKKVLDIAEKFNLLP